MAINFQPERLSGFASMELPRLGKWLYFLTLMLEFGAIWSRLIIGFFLALVVFSPVWLLLTLCSFVVALSEGPETVTTLFTLLVVASLIGGVIVAFAPLVMSIVAAFEGKGGYTVTRFALGARHTSRREHEQIAAAFHSIPYSLEKIKAPSNWFVIDSPTPNAYVVGNTLYVTRGLIASEHLAAVIAHELGHINYKHHSGLTLALRRLILPPLYALTNTSGSVAPGTVTIEAIPNSAAGFLLSGGVWMLSLLMSLFWGGVGIWLLSPLWVWYWRRCEYEADEFAVTLGMGRGLIEYLEKYQFFDVAAPYFMSSHPYTELRIDRLLAYEEGTPSTTKAATSLGDLLSGFVDDLGQDPDLKWIRANLQALVDLSGQGYQSVGRGAVVIDMGAVDPLNDGKSNWYTSAKKVIEVGDPEAVIMVESYSPGQEIVVILLKGEEKSRNYMVGV